MSQFKPLYTAGKPGLGRKRIRSKARELRKKRVAVKRFECEGRKTREYRERGEP